MKTNQTELTLFEQEEPTTIIIPRTKEGLKPSLDLLERMRVEGLRADPERSKIVDEIKMNHRRYWAKRIVFTKKISVPADEEFKGL